VLDLYSDCLFLYYATIPHMNKIKKTTHGFTLIELLVVISIIGLLSSVVFASLNTAREKSRLSGIKQEMVELRNALELNYSAISGYNNLDSYQAGLISSVWINVEIDCDTAYGPASDNVLAGETIGTAQILPICKKLVSLANKTGNPNIGALVIKGDVPNKYSITVASHDNNDNYYCMGSSGVSFAAITPFSVGATLGCYANP